MVRVLAACVLLAALFLFASSVRAASPEMDLEHSSTNVDIPISTDDYWWGGFSGTVVNGVVNDVIHYGGSWIVGGEFTSAGGISGTQGIARWSGGQWTSISPPGLTAVKAVGEYQGELYVGGYLLTAWGAPSDFVMRWDGTNWNAVGIGTNGAVHALGTVGTDLIVGGEFTQAGGLPAKNIARWDGSSWSALGSGLGSSLGDRVLDVIEFQGEIIAAGVFAGGGGSPNGIARWDGSSWKKMGGMDGNVLALAVYQGSLIAGGTFTSSGGGGSPAYIARWSGSSWQALGSGTGGWVGDLTVQGGYLYAAGGFNLAGGGTAMRVARWDGSSWSPAGSGMEGSFVQALATDGTDVLAGGSFGFADGAEADNLALWNGSAWSGAMSHSGGGLSSDGRALLALGDSLVVGGGFSSAGGSGADRVACWNGFSWSPIGSDLNGDVLALTAYGGDLVAAGTFTEAGGNPANRIARWDGSQWNALGTGMNGAVNAVAVYAGDLYAAGMFSAAGGVLVNNVARWDGTSWSDVGGGVEPLPGAAAWVNTLAVFDGELVVGGHFDRAGGALIRTIAAWNGSSWGALGSGGWTQSETFEPEIMAMTISGVDLIVGGDFTSGPEGVGPYIARWYGSGWSGVGNPGAVISALLNCEGTLFVGAGSDVRAFDGSTWTTLGGGMSDDVNALAEFQGKLFAAGGFSRAGNKPSMHAARWDGQQVGIADPTPSPILFSAFPNPFLATTTLVYELRRPGVMNLAVFDVQGRRLATLASEFRPAGQYELNWDGTTNAGNRLPAGIYYLHLRTEDARSTQKLVRIR